MKGKTYIVSTLSIVFVILILFGAFTVMVDPLFQYHKPWFGMEPVVTDDRYQVAGMAKTFEYDNAILGNSMSENFRVSDVNSVFGGDSVKLTISGSRSLDWSYLLGILINKNPRNVMINIDPSTFAASSTELEHDLPTYLYNNNIVDDVNYLLNFSIMQKFTLPMINNNISGTTTDLDTLFMWDDKYGSGKAIVLNGYQRLPISNESADIGEYCKNIDNNLKLLTDYFSVMQDTTFTIYFSPYSMLFWDEQTRSNKVEMQKAGFLEACSILTDIDNVDLYLWNDKEMLEIMSDLDNYKDTNHYNGDVSRNLLQRIKNRQGLLTRENYKEEVGKLFNYIETFDYESLFE